MLHFMSFNLVPFTFFVMQWFVVVNVVFHSLLSSHVSTAVGAWVWGEVCVSMNSFITFQGVKKCMLEKKQNKKKTGLFGVNVLILRLIRCTSKFFFTLCQRNPHLCLKMSDLSAMFYPLCARFPWMDPIKMFQSKPFKDWGWFYWRSTEDKD